MIELISIHIPKTAGRSFLAILKSVYDNKTLAHFDRKNYHDKNNNNFSPVELFKSQLSHEIKVIHGHFHFNEVKDLQNINSAKVITWMRDPVERVISNFSFFKKRISQSLNDIQSQKRSGESLLEYAMLENSRNRMSKFTQGLKINNFFFIGITEFFETDIKILGRMLEWKSFPVERINDNTEFKSQLPEVTDEERKIVAELNSIDVELYRKVLEIHNTRIN